MGQDLAAAQHGRDVSGVDAIYLRAVSDVNYQSAFMKTLANPLPGAQALLSAREQEAMERVGAAMSMRAMAVGEGSTGGFAVPVALDPTIILTSAGAASPLRELANTVTISSSEWKGVASAGVTAHFRKEAAEVEDDSPELTQPAIKPERGDVFVPFSIEVGSDWSAIQSELTRLMADAKNTLEAEKFTKGDGSDEPYGIMVGTTEQETKTEDKLEVEDTYTIVEKLPARFQANASWMTTLTIANNLYKAVGGGSEEPSVFNSDRTKLLGKNWYENSMMDSALESGKLVALYGDVRAGFTIVDRLGMTVELVPHLFGEERLPTGQRGLLAIWRTGSKVTNKTALVTAKVK